MGLAVAIKTYRYNGQYRTSIDLPPAKEGELPIAVALNPGCTVELPDDMLYVKRNVLKGLFTEVEQPKPASTRKKSYHVRGG